MKILYEKVSAFDAIFIYEDEEYPHSVIFQRTTKTGNPVDTLIPKEAIIQVAQELKEAHND